MTYFGRDHPRFFTLPDNPLSRYPGFNTYMDFERGFHGWLVLFFVSSCLAACVRGYIIFQTAGELRLAIQSSTVPLSLIVAALLFFRTSLFVATVVGLVMLAKADSRTPTFWACLLIASILANGAQIAFAAYEATLLDREAFISTLWPPLSVREFWGTTVTLAWLFYWLRSRGVRLTFGRNAFSAMSSSTIESVVRTT